MMIGWRGCTGATVGLLLLHIALGARESTRGDGRTVFEATYKIDTEEGISEEEFLKAFKPVLAAREDIKVLSFRNSLPGEAQAMAAKRAAQRTLLSADSPAQASNAAASAAALNPGASMQGTGKKAEVTRPDQVTLAPGQSIGQRIGFGLQQTPSVDISGAQGSSGGSLWDASVSAASAIGESVSLYTPSGAAPQTSKPFTGFGLQQRPAQTRPMADSFLQLDRHAAAHAEPCPACCDVPAPSRADAPALAAAAPAGGDASVRALKQGDIQAPRHYWDTSEEGIGLEQPLKDGGFTSLGSMHVQPSVRTGFVQAASVQQATPISSAALLGAPTASRRLLAKKGATNEVEDDSWAREGWDADITAAKSGDAQEDKAGKGPRKAKAASKSAGSEQKEPAAKAAREKSADSARDAPKKGITMKAAMAAAKQLPKRAAQKAQGAETKQDQEPAQPEAKDAKDAAGDSKEQEKSAPEKSVPAPPAKENPKPGLWGKKGPKELKKEEPSAEANASSLSALLDDIESKQVEQKQVEQKQVAQTHGADSSRQEEDIEPKLRDFIQKAVDRAVADFKSMASSQVAKDGGKATSVQKAAKQPPIVTTTVVVRVSSPEHQLQRLLTHPSLMQILMDNFKEQGIDVSRVADEAVAKIMADGTKRALSSGRQQRRAPWGSGAARGLLQDGANIMPEQEALPGHLVSAIKAAAGFVSLRSA